MSVLIRGFFDKIHHSPIFKNIRLPVPPYDDPAYWDRVYKDISTEDCIEWGGFDLKGLLNFRYELLCQQRNNLEFEHPQEKSIQTSSFSEWMDLMQYHTPEEASKKCRENYMSDNLKNEAIVLLGCGNSKFGEQLLTHSFTGPFLHVDISSKLIQSMKERYETHLNELVQDRMKFLLDDATMGLTSMETGSIGGGIVDKGLLDSFHCSMKNLNIEYGNSHEGNEKWDSPIQRMIESVHRVLRPSRPFLFFSRSSPEYILRRAFGSGKNEIMGMKKWMDIKVVKLVDLNVIMYRFVKRPEPDSLELNQTGLSPASFRRKLKQKRNR